LPLLILALGDRISDGSLLSRPFEFISSVGGILFFLAMVTLELVLDKIPRFDHILDIFGSVLRPASAALCFMAVAAHDESMHPILAMFFGLIIGGVVHWDKAQRRLLLAESGPGLGTPFVSMTEDFVAIVTAVSSLLLGILGPFVALGGWFLVRATYRWSETFGKATIERARAADTLRR
jgi:hypothetical protein